MRDPQPKPEHAILFYLMLDWAPDEGLRNRILVDNAAVLYDFPKSWDALGRPPLVPASIAAIEALPPRRL